jgi:hypothetical protein
MNQTDLPILAIVVEPDVAAALTAIGQEVMRARAKFKRFNSAHEGYAVLLEEVDELWEEVKRHQSARNPERMRIEAVQIAAMAVRFLTDVLGGAGVLENARTHELVDARAPVLSHPPGGDRG